MGNIIKLFDDIKSIEDKEENLRRNIKIEFEKMLTEFMRNYSKHVKEVYWEQYTPYFMDGDACEFSVHELQCRFAHQYDEDGDYENGEYYYDAQFYDEEKYEEYRLIHEIYEQSDNDEDKLKKLAEEKNVPLYNFVNFSNSVEWNRKDHYLWEMENQLTLKMMPEEMKNDFNDILEAFNIFSKFFKDIYGDHVAVSVTKDGMEFNEVHHD